MKVGYILKTHWKYIIAADYNRMSGDNYNSNDKINEVQAEIDKTKETVQKGIGLFCVAFNAIIMWILCRMKNNIIL